MTKLGTGTGLTFSRPRGNAVAPPPPPPALTRIEPDGWQATWPSPPAQVSGTAISVIRQGFTSAGTATTVTDALSVTARVRDPGVATPSADKVALSDYVYAADTIAGIPNTSALPYPYAQFAWAVADRQEVRGNTVFVRIAVAHRHARGGRPVAAVRFIVRDHLGAEASLLVTACTTHSYAASGLTGCFYEGTVDITALSSAGGPSSFGGTDAKTLTIDAEFRPWVGTAHTIGTIAAAKTASGNRTLSFGNNRNGWRQTLYAYVSPTGNNATAAVSTAAATAAASPFATTAAADIALRDWHNTNTGRGVLDGCVMRLTEGVHVHSAWTRRTCDHFTMTMEGAPGTDPAAVIYTDGGATTDNSFAQMITLRNLTLRKSSAASVRMLDSGSTDPQVSYLAMTNVTLSANGFAPAGNMVYRYGTKYSENCVQTANLASADKVIGCLGEFTAAPTTACLASRVPSGQINPNTAAIVDGLFVGWSHITADKAIYLQTFALGFTTTELGIALVGNIFEQFGSGSGASGLLNGDGNTDSSKNVNIIGNTIVGGRINVSYTDFGGAVRRDHLTVLRFNILDQENHKAGDFFSYAGDTTNPARVGNWNIRYGVGALANTVLKGESRPNGGNSYYPMSWLGDVQPPLCLAGTQDVPLNVAFVDDRSGGAGTGAGDYTPATAPDLTLIPAGLAPWPADLKGRALPNGGTAVAGAVQRP